MSVLGRLRPRRRRRRRRRNEDVETGRGRGRRKGERPIDKRVSRSSKKKGGGGDGERAKRHEGQGEEEERGEEGEGREEERGEEGGGRYDSLGEDGVQARKKKKRKVNGEGYEQVGEWVMGREMGNLALESEHGEILNNITQTFYLLGGVREGGNGDVRKEVRIRQEDLRSYGGKQKIISNK